MNWDKSKDDLREELSRQVNKRKPTAKWCKGKIGREHEPELVLNHNWTSRTTCGWRDLMMWRGGERVHWKWQYSCYHSMQCKNCGKYTEWTLKNKDDCPDYTPNPERGGE